MKMFRDCYFEYAGIYSGDYNLKLMYIEDNYQKRLTGGNYTLLTNDNGLNPEKQLYGKQFTPLEFDIEIVSVDGIIPFNQFIEIKEWLFNQKNQWHKLKIYSEEYQDIFFYCQLIPNEDFCDGQGYRAIRCKVQCNSSFAYKDNVTQTANRQDSLTSNLPMKISINTEIATQDCMPLIQINTLRGTAVKDMPYGNDIILFNQTNNTATYLTLDNNISVANVTVKLSINCQTGIISHSIVGYSEKNLKQELYLGTNSFTDKSSGTIYGLNCGLMKLSKGINDIWCYGTLNSCSITYSPTVRVGAF